MQGMLLFCRNPSITAPSPSSLKIALNRPALACDPAGLPAPSGWRHREQLRNENLPARRRGEHWGRQGLSRTCTARTRKGKHWGRCRIKCGIVGLRAHLWALRATGSKCTPKTVCREAGEVRKACPVPAPRCTCKAPTALGAKGWGVMLGSWHGHNSPVCPQAS